MGEFELGSLPDVADDVRRLSVSSKFEESSLKPAPLPRDLGSYDSRG